MNLGHISFPQLWPWGSGGVKYCCRVSPISTKLGFWDLPGRSPRPSDLGVNWVTITHIKIESFLYAQCLCINTYLGNHLRKISGILRRCGWRGTRRLWLRARKSGSTRWRGGFSTIFFLGNCFLLWIYCHQNSQQYSTWVFAFFCRFTAIKIGILLHIFVFQWCWGANRQGGNGEVTFNFAFWSDYTSSW